LIFSNLCEIKFTKQSLHYFFEKVKICLQKAILTWNKTSFQQLFSHKKDFAVKIVNFPKYLAIFFSKTTILFF